MAYKYRLLSAATLLGLIGWTTYSIAAPGNYQEAFVLMSHSPQLMLDDANEVPVVEEEDVVVEQEEQSEEVVVPEPVSTVAEEKPVETISEPQVESVVEPAVVETQKTPKPQEETPKVEEVVVEEPVIEVKESTSVSVEPQPQPPAKPSETSDNKAPKKTKKVEGAQVSHGPLTVAQNPDNKGVYSGHELGKQWEDSLLDTSNSSWWITNEKHLLDKIDESNLKTEEFRLIHRQLKEKQSSGQALDGNVLMELCKKQYTHHYRYQNDSYATDIWSVCLKRDEKPKTSK